MVAALLSLLVAAPAAEAYWLDDPVPLDATLDAASLSRLGQAVEQALRPMAAPAAIGAAAILAAASRTTTSDSPGIVRARSLVNEGKERYMAFEFGPAAAGLAEAAGLLTNDLAGLDDTDIARLYEARLLEGVAWVEAGQDGAAKAAFKKLLTIRPDFEPDPVLVPPGAREVFRQSLTELRSMGVASLQVRSEPAGAEVVVDGVRRGKTPLGIGGLPAGDHGVRLTLAGYQGLARGVTLRAGQEESVDVRLSPSALLTAYERVRAAARAGESPSVVLAELQTLAAATGCSAVVLVGVARRPGGLLVSLRRFAPAGPSAVLVVADPANPAAALADAAPRLFAGSWPAIQVPVGSVPVVTDFTRALLGLGPGWGGEPADEGGILRAWWFWTGVAVLVGGAAATGIWVASSGGGEPAPDRVHFTLEFP